MTRTDRTAQDPLECWNCGARATAARVVVETVIRGRPRDDGGPYRVFRCVACGVENGVLPGPGGGWMLYPLAGLSPPSVLDRILSARERLRLAKARAWWGAHRGRVERFRRSAQSREGTQGRDVPPRAAPRPPPPPRPRARPAAPPPPPPQRATRPVAAAGPRAVLGVAADATLTEIRRAFRALAKRHHPDRDPTAGAAERFRRIRAAYEELVIDLGG